MMIKLEVARERQEVVREMSRKRKTGISKRDEWQEKYRK
jgi:hypothetical protein